MRRVLSGLLILTILIFCFSIPICAIASEVELNEQYIHHFDYPLTVDSPEWDTLTPAERVEMLIIPEDILSRMTDEALIQAIAEYPHLVDIYAYGDTLSESIEVTRVYFSALDELLSRNTAIQSMLDYGVSLATEYLSTASSRTISNSTHDTFVSNALFDILEATTSDITVSFNVDDSIAIPFSDTTTVYAPNGTPVTVVIVTAPQDPDALAAKNQEFVEIYNVTLYAQGNNKYNCHSYAWYSTAPTNSYWMRDPSAYMRDGSYISRYSGTPNVSTSSTSIAFGDRIYYGNHSAIYRGTSGTSGNLANQPCRSKWGLTGVFDHALTNVPPEYNTSREPLI